MFGGQRQGPFLACGEEEEEEEEELESLLFPSPLLALLPLGLLQTTTRDR